MMTVEEPHATDVVASSSAEAKEDNGGLEDERRGSGKPTTPVESGKERLSL